MPLPLVLLGKCYWSLDLDHCFKQGLYKQLLCFNLQQTTRIGQLAYPFQSYSRIVRCTKDIVCNVLRYRFTSDLMHAESILTPCQKVCYNQYACVPYISSFILQWHIYIEGVFLILCRLSCKKKRVSPERFGIYSSTNFAR